MYRLFLTLLFLFFAKGSSCALYDRGYIINERDMPITVELVGFNRNLRRYHVQPGEFQRIMRLFNRVAIVVVNGQPFNKCKVEGQEHDVPIQTHMGDAIVVREDKDDFPYIECTSVTNEL